MRAHVGCFVVACAVASCGGTPTSTTGGGAVAKAPGDSSTAGAGTSPVAATSPKDASPLPPSGVWDLEVRVVRDTCSPKIASGLTENGLFVLSHATKAGKIILNVPFVAAKGTTVARSDVLAEPGSKLIAPKTLPDPACPSYVVERITTVASVAHDRVVIERVTKYGDRALCPPQPPSICETELAYTYSLVRAECELPCSGQVDLSSPKEPKLKCVCP